MYNLENEKCYFLGTEGYSSILLCEIEYETKEAIKNLKFKAQLSIDEKIKSIRKLK